MSAGATAMNSMDVSIQVEGHRIRMEFGGIGIRDGVLAQLSCDHPAAHMMKARNPGMAKWDGTINFYDQDPENLSQYTAPIGFLPRIKAFLAKFSLRADVQGELEPLEGVEFEQLLTDGTVLDPIQVDACTALLQNRLCCLELATASGKTEVLINASLVLMKRFPKYRVLIIVPRLNLLRQTAQRVADRTGQSVGVVGGGEFDWDYPFVVATTQTACGSDNLSHSVAIRAWLKTINVLCLDEAHHGKSDQNRALIESSGHEWLWAVSGKMTYIVKDNQNKHLELEGMFGPPVFKGANTERQCPVIVVAHKCPSWKGVLAQETLRGSPVDGLPCLYKLADGAKWLRGVYHGPGEDGRHPLWMVKFHPTTRRRTQIYPNGVYTFVDGGGGDQHVDVTSDNIVYWTRHDIGLMEFMPRNEWAVELAKWCRDRKEPFIVTVKRRKHLRRLELMFKRARISVGVIGGHLTGKQQNVVLDQIRAGEVAGILAVYTTVGEGTDIPGLAHLIKLDGVTDEQAIEQAKGRVQRKCDGKVRGYLHVPRDSQHPALDRDTGKVLQYFRNTNVTVKTIDHPIDGHAFDKIPTL